MAKNENHEAHNVEDVEDVEAVRKQHTSGEKPKDKVETRPASKAGVETR